MRNTRWKERTKKKDLAVVAVEGIGRMMIMNFIQSSSPAALTLIPPVVNRRTLSLVSCYLRWHFSPRYILSSSSHGHSRAPSEGQTKGLR